ncbi:MAG: hypothetical protein V4662_24475 [Verrucomicrobiota bacterium]
MYLLHQFLPAVGVAVVCAAILSAVALCGKSGSKPLAQSACALGVASGYFAGHVFITGWIPLPPTDTTNWLPYFVIVAVVISAIAPLLSSRTVRGAVLGLICAGAMRFLLAPKFRYEWSVEQGWLWVACLGGGIVLLTLSVRAMARHSSMALESPLLLSLIAAGTAGALMLSGSLLLGQFAAVLSAAVLGTLVLASRDRTAFEGAATVFSLLEGALLACGYFFAELPALSVLLLATAPAVALIANRVSAPSRSVAARACLVLAPTVCAVLAAFFTSPNHSA